MSGTSGTIRKRLRNPLRPLGATVGVLLVVAALVAVAGAPWATGSSMAAAVVQLLAAVAMAGIGVGLAYISLAAGD